MEVTTRVKLEEMLSNKAVVLTDSQLDELQAEEIEVRTACHARQCGTLDKWVGWISPDPKARPEFYSKSEDLMYMSALPGVLVYP